MTLKPSSLLQRLFAPPPSRPAPEPYSLDLDGIQARVTRKPIRTFTLRLKPPDGSVHVSAPLRASEHAIQAFVRERLDWIRRHQARMALRPAAAVPAYEDGEAIPFLGRRLTLRWERRGRLATAKLEADALRLRAPSGATRAQRERAVQRCLARALLAEAQARLPHWEAQMALKASALKVRAMRSRWGVCKTREAVITLSTALARFGPEALDYILVHELAHLRVRSHGPRFRGLLDKHYPGWRILRKTMNGTA